MIICLACAKDKKIPDHSFKEIFGQCDLCRYYSLCKDIPDRIAKYFEERLRKG